MKKTSILKIACVALAATSIGLAVKLHSTQTTATVNNITGWTVGTINASGKVEEAKDSMYTGFITSDGLEIELVKNADITYQVVYYDNQKEFISKSSVYSADFDNSTIAETAEWVRIVATPTNDDDGEISLTEKYSYAKQITVTYAK